MLKSLVATTCEIDDADAAVAEILQALDIERNLKKHSLGIISCFSEYEDTGVLKAICDALPFDCIGSTTCINSANGKTDQIMLSLMVLTSDDCSFKTSFISVSNEYEKSITENLSPLIKDGGNPSMILCYFPLMNNIGGDMLLSAIDNVTGGIPLYGTTAVDHTHDYSLAKTIYNGEAYREAVVLCLVYGNVNFSFAVATLNEENVRKQKAIITEAEGNLLIGVNEKNAMEYFEEIGLTQNDLATVSGILPIVVDHKDGTKPVVRTVFSFTPDGRAVCGGKMTVGATLSIGKVEVNDVLQTSVVTLSPYLQNKGAVLSYSCLARYLILGARSTAEAEKIGELAKDMHYMFACSGGEVCPLPDANGKLVNYYHNFTNVFCILN
ncbi:MAG: FIST C-terminal domain-containing protein [Defluviitaleaceae bacterium]|nr:FIST C-terminal domain-containing protein [Defluviitaleaceae bacterium]